MQLRVCSIRGIWCVKKRDNVSWHYLFLYAMMVLLHVQQSFGQIHVYDALLLVNGTYKCFLYGDE